jgi:hypothetical protein
VQESLQANVTPDGASGANVYGQEFHRGHVETYEGEFFCGWEGDDLFPSSSGFEVHEPQAISYNQVSEFRYAPTEAKGAQVMGPADMGSYPLNSQVEYAGPGYGDHKACWSGQIGTSGASKSSSELGREKKRRSSHKMSDYTQPGQQGFSVVMRDAQRWLHNQAMANPTVRVTSTILGAKMLSIAESVLPELRKYLATDSPVF